VRVGSALAIVSTAGMSLAILGIRRLDRPASSFPTILLIPRLRLFGPRFVPFHACMALVSFSPESLRSSLPVIYQRLDPDPI
jgi:hypothetical protein